METKHTPGPWFSGLDKHCPDLVHTANPNGRLAEKLVGVGRAQPDGSFDEACANARLIAAAPELLAACESMIAVIRKISAHNIQKFGMFPEVDRMNAAIAKAKGEEDA